LTKSLAIAPICGLSCYLKVYEGIDPDEHHSAKLVGYLLLATALKLEKPDVRLYHNFTETVEAVWASPRLGA
jgi:hypothetical protein